MNQIFHINLGGTALTIDQDAYSILKDYLLELHKHFENTEEKEEITADIEQRIGEILEELRGGSIIVSTSNVEQAIEMMGRPSDFHEEDPEEIPKEKAKNNSFESFSSKFGKRLFRDTDDSVLGGVCSGFSAYLGIQNPVFIRFLFILFIFGFGVSFLFYILLWIIIPEAKTNSERLQMRGEKVNVENLSKIIKEEADRLSKKVKDLGEEWNEKLGNKNFANESFNFNNISNAAGEGLKQLPTFLEKLARIIKNMVGGTGLAVSGLMWIGLIALVVKGKPFLSVLPNAEGSFAGFLSLNIALLVGLPIIYLGYKFTRILFKTKVNKVLAGILTGLWIASTISFSYMITSTATHYSKSSTSSETVSMSTNIDQINLKGEWITYSNQSELTAFLQESDIVNSSSDLDLLKYEFRESPNSELKFEIHKTARAKTEERANKLAQKIELNIKQEGDDISIPLNIPYLVDGKFVVPSVKLVVFVPKGKSIQFDEEILKRVPYFTDKGTCEQYQLGENGFTCADLNTEVVSEKDATL